MTSVDAAARTFLVARDALLDTPEVLYGGFLALAIVLVLTPAVGGMARRLGVVDAPDLRRLNALPIPRLGGLALFVGILVPSLAFLPIGREMRGLLLGAAVAASTNRCRRGSASSCATPSISS